MFSQIWNYMLLPVAISSCSIGVYYIINPESAKNIFSYLMWHGVNLYSKATILFEQIVQIETLNDADDTKEVMADLSYYNCDNKLQISMGQVPPLPGKWWNDFHEKVDLLILKNLNSSEKQYKVFNSYKDLQYDTNEWKRIENPFVQVELEQKGQDPISIHNNLAPFYIKGNKILDKTFLTWYLKKWYNITLGNDYVLKIFDKNVELFEIDKSKYIYMGDKGHCVRFIDDVNNELEDKDNTASPLLSEPTNNKQELLDENLKPSMEETNNNEETCLEKKGDIYNQPSYSPWF